MLSRAQRNSEADKKEDYELRERKLEGSLDRLVFGMFQIDVRGLIQKKVSLAKNFHIQPSEIDQMPYWEYEFFIEELNNQVKEENETQEQEMEKYHVRETLENTRPDKMNKMTSAVMNPKMPSMPNMNFGSMKF